MKRIVCTVTTDLNYDQRMIRICTSLAAAGYHVTLVGRQTTRSTPLNNQLYHQQRLRCWFSTGKLFYAEFNLRLFFYLLFVKADLVCAIDLDSILPVYIVSKMRNIKRVYDAHELFCEMKEIVSRRFIYKCWKWIERRTVPHFPDGYTVNRPIADEFERMYNVRYEVIRNIPLNRSMSIPEKKEKYLLYQGAVNEGRSFETLIPAMKWVNAPLYICGEGNFMTQAQQLVKKHELENKVIFKGKIMPDQLRSITQHAWAGVTLFDAEGKSNYYSLANRFFDYIHGGIPQLCVDYPVYRDLNNQYEIAVLTADLSPENLAKQLNELLNNPLLYHRLQKNCLEAREIWNWQSEEKKLLEFYKRILG